MRVKINGYYISEPMPWVDWHAGHKFEGVTYKILKFINDREFIRLSTDLEHFSIDLLSQKEESKDQYKILDDKTLLLVINPKSKYSKKRYFTMLSSETLLDENMVEYTFRPIS